MKNFNYRARDANGQLQKGVLSADSTQSAADMLIREQLIPIDIQWVDTAKKSFFKDLIDKMSKIEITPPKIKLIEKTLFCRQIYSLLSAGVPLVQAIYEVQKNIRNKAFKLALQDIERRLASGSGLAAAMRLHPNIFSSIFINICEAGEESGKLQDAFLQMVSHFELEEHISKQFGEAMRYPIMLSCVMFIAIIVINVFVIPSFQKVFDQNHMKLPILTRILIASSKFFLAYWPAMLFVIAVVITAYILYKRTPEGANQIDYLKMKIPMLGGIFHRILLGRFSRVFGMMLGAGVPLSRSILLTANAMENAYFKNRLKLMQKVIEHGEPLTKAAISSGLFSAMTIQMLSVGELSGKIEEMLNQSANFYEREVDYELGKLGAAIEPIMAVVMGGVVLCLALGVFLPMWNMVNMAK